VHGQKAAFSIGIVDLCMKFLPYHKIAGLNLISALVSNNTEIQNALRGHHLKLFEWFECTLRSNMDPILQVALTNTLVELAKNNKKNQKHIAKIGIEVVLAEMLTMNYALPLSPTTTSNCLYLLALIRSCNANAFSIISSLVFERFLYSDNGTIRELAALLK